MDRARMLASTLRFRVSDACQVLSLPKVEALTAGRAGTTWPVQAKVRQRRL
jgi:hypothetical protein